MMRIFLMMVALTTGFAGMSWGQTDVGAGGRPVLPESCVVTPLTGHALSAAAKDDGGLVWGSSVEGARKDAKSSGSAVLVYFRGKVCEDCDRLQAVTFADGYIRMRLEGLSLVRLDRSDVSAAKVADKFGVKGVPALVMLSPEGKVLKRVEGFVDKDRLLEFLRQ